MTSTSEAAGIQRLDPRAVTRFRVAALGRAGLLVAAVAAAEWALEPPIPFLAPTAMTAFLAALYAVMVPRLRYRAWGYRLRESDLVLHYGVLFRTTSIVPHARIQHVDTGHGPLDRWLGLAELVVYTAGMRGGILSVPGLEAATAEQLRDRLVALSGAGDAV